MTTYEFGLLDGLWEKFDFEFGSVEPIIDPSKVTEILLSTGYYEQANKRWWIYPPQSHEESQQNGEYHPREHIERPAHLWTLTPSHKLELSNNNTEDRELADIIIQTLAWLHGTRLQFSDWLHEGRRIIRNERRSIRFQIFPDETPEVIWQLINHYRSLDNENKQHIRRLLHQRNRANIYQWHWEEFSCLYIALDTCWALLTNTGQIENPGRRLPHRDRMQKICDDLSININHPSETNLFEFWVKTRNGLMHEALWMSTIPGYSSDQDNTELILRFPGFIDRIIFYCLGVDYKTRPDEHGELSQNPTFKRHSPLPIKSRNDILREDIHRYRNRRKKDQ